MMMVRRIMGRLMMDRLFKHVDGNCIVSFVVSLGFYGIEV